MWTFKPLCCLLYVCLGKSESSPELNLSVRAQMSTDDLDLDFLIDKC